EVPEVAVMSDRHAERAPSRSSVLPPPEEVGAEAKLGEPVKVGDEVTPRLGRMELFRALSPKFVVALIDGLLFVRISTLCDGPSGPREAASYVYARYLRSVMRRQNDVHSPREPSHEEEPPQPPLLNVSERQ